MVHPRRERQRPPTKPGLTRIGDMAFSRTSGSFQSPTICGIYIRAPDLARPELPKAFNQGLPGKLVA